MNRDLLWFGLNALGICDNDVFDCDVFRSHKHTVLGCEINRSYDHKLWLRGKACSFNSGICGYSDCLRFNCGTDPSLFLDWFYSDNLWRSLDAVDVCLDH